MESSRTMQALAMVERGETVANAARKAEISTAAIYTALRRRKGKPICPACGQVVRPGFSVTEYKVAEDRAEYVVDPVLAYRQRLLAAIGQMRQGHRLSDETIKVVDWIEQWIELNQ